MADVSGPAPQPVFRWREHTARILASNTKLFTTTAALARFGDRRHARHRGARHRRARRRGRLPRQPLPPRRRRPHLRQPPLHQHARTAAAPPSRTSPTPLDEAGIQRVTGRVYGDESAFDSLRGGPDSGYGVSIWVGPLSGLSYNRGLFTEGGRGFQANPPAFAAARLDDALEARHIPVRLKPRAGADPGRGHRPGERRLAARCRGLIRLTNKPSDNFFAETLLKDLAHQAGGVGTTARGARDRHPLRPHASARARGSWTARASRAATAPRPFSIVKLLTAMRSRADSDAVPRLALHRGQRRHALRPHAPRARPPPLHRQDRHAVERQRAVGLLRGARAATTTPTRSS